MPGRVKKRIPRPRSTAPPFQKKGLEGRVPQVPPSTSSVAQPAAGVPAPPAAATSSFSLLSGKNTDLRSQIVDKHALPWLIILSTLVVLALIFVSYLLCRCRRRRRQNKDGTSNVNSAGHAHHPSLEVKDGRNKYHAWNRNVEQPIAMVDRTWAKESGSLTPLAKAAVRPAGWQGNGVGGNVVEVAEDDDGISPLDTRFDRRVNERKGGLSAGSGGWGEWWKRVSQIGRAY